MWAQACACARVAKPHEAMPQRRSWWARLSRTAALASTIAATIPCSHGAGAGSGGLGPAAIEKRNTLPRPGSLSTSMVPPRSSTRRLQIASPSPVPPKRRVVEASTWEKGWNRRMRLSAGMPIPLSWTEKCSMSACRRTSTWTSPSAVNLTALLTRLARTWRRRVGSDMHVVGQSAPS